MDWLVHTLEMATKTISIELDAYEKLCAAKNAGESFSEVVRRATFADAPVTDARLLAYYRSGGSAASEHFLDSIEEAAKHDPIPDNPWV